MIYDIQKASLMKRLSAFLLDFILAFMLSVGFMLLLTNITNFDYYSNGYHNRIAEIEQAYNISELSQKHNITLDQFDMMTDDEKEALSSKEDMKEVVLTFEKCIATINSDSDVIHFYEMRFTLAPLIPSIGILLASWVLDFIVPLLFKNGQTLGKKLFSIAVMRVDGVKVSTFELFVRSILGKYTIETMVPFLMLITLFGNAPLMPLAVLLLIFLLEVVTMITTKTNSLLHDKLASTVVVDLQSQMIFDSVRAMQEYKAKIHKEMADKADY